MPQLIVDHLHCLSDTGQWTDDRVYLLLVIADRGGRCRLRAYHHAPDGWQDLAEGERRREVLVVDPDWAPDSLVLAALFERNGASDLAPETGLAPVLEQLEGVRRLFTSLREQPRVFLAAELLTAMDRALHAALDDDRKLGQAQLVEPADGRPLELSFAAGKGHYRLRFLVK
ncbi:MAG: hypothetical protein Q8Q73_16425 [Stagnimonas sp.]|nr:hypothetical protein [Stagnimonas sp.]